MNRVCDGSVGRRYVVGCDAQGRDVASDELVCWNDLVGDVWSCRAGTEIVRVRHSDSRLSGSHSSLSLAVSVPRVLGEAVVEVVGQVRAWIGINGKGIGIFKLDLN